MGGGFGIRGIPPGCPGRRAPVRLVIPRHAYDKLGQQKGYLILIADMMVAELREKLPHQGKNVLSVLPVPKGGGTERIHQRGERPSLRFSDLQADTVFLHGRAREGNLGMFHMWARDIKGVGYNVIVLPVRKQLALSRADIVDFIAAASMAVGGNRRCQFLKHNIGGLDGDSVYGKMCVDVIVRNFHGNIRRLSLCIGTN